jgi:hypothetical protein
MITIKMLPQLLNQQEFECWLLTKKENNSVGMRVTAYCCPLANWLQESYNVSVDIHQYGSVKGYAVLKTINTGGFIMIPVPLCLTCLERNFETGFLTTLGLFLAHSFRYNFIDNFPS